MDILFLLYIGGWGVAILVGAILLVEEDTYYDKKIKK